MRPLALLIGLAFIAIGLAGVIHPDFIVAVAHRVASPGGLFIVAAIRVGIAVVLGLAARAARTPTALRLLAALFLISGVITPFLSPETALSVFDAFATRVSLRLWSAAVVALGAFIAYTVSDGRRAVYRRPAPAVP